MALHALKRAREMAGEAQLRYDAITDHQSLHRLEIRRRVSRNAMTFQPAAASASAAALPIPFDAPVMTIDRVIMSSSGFSCRLALLDDRFTLGLH